jgi:Tfp pilus assembly protein PilF
MTKMNEATINMTKHMTRAGLAAACALSLIATGCAGAKPATKSEQSNQAKNASGPPLVPTTTQPKIDRQVTKEATNDFKAAVAFYEDKAKDGLTNDECVASAKKFEDVADSHDKLVEAWFNAGVAYQKCGMTKEAEAEYQKALKINPAHAPSLVNLGEIYYRGGNERVGQQYFEQAMKADGTVGGSYVNLAWIQYDKMRDASSDAEKAKWEKEALFNLKNALAVDNDNVVARVLMAMVYMEGSDKNKNRLDIAQMLLDGVLKNKPTLKDNASDDEKKAYAKDMARYESNARYPLLYNALGLLYMKRNSIGKALTYFRKAVELDPEFVEARLNLGFTVLGFRKYEDAATAFEGVLKQQPKNYDAKIGMGVALRGERKIDEAETAYKEAMQLNKDRGDAYFNLGVLWKDFRTNDADQKKNREAYRTAKGYFRDYLTKADAKGDKKKDAQDYIEDCDKAIATLDQVINQMENAPPPEPTPAPTKTSAPAGDAAAPATPTPAAAPAPAPAPDKSK